MILMSTLNLSCDDSSVCMEFELWWFLCVHWIWIVMILEFILNLIGDGPGVYIEFELWIRDDPSVNKF